MKRLMQKIGRCKDWTHKELLTSNCLNHSATAALATVSCFFKKWFRQILQNWNCSQCNLILSFWWILQFFILNERIGLYWLQFQFCKMWRNHFLEKQLAVANAAVAEWLRQLLITKSLSVRPLCLLTFCINLFMFKTCSKWPVTLIGNVQRY